MTDFGTESGVVAVTVCDHGAQKPLEFGCGKSLEKLAREVLECYECYVLLVGAQRTRMLTEMKAVKIRLKRFQLATRILLAVALKNQVCYALVQNVSTLCLCPEISWEIYN